MTDDGRLWALGAVAALAAAGLVRRRGSAETWYATAEVSKKQLHKGTAEVEVQARDQADAQERVYDWLELAGDSYDITWDSPPEVLERDVAITNLRPYRRSLRDLGRRR